MARYPRKNTRLMQDMPGLFDVNTEDGFDIYQDIVKRQRENQISPSHHLSSDELLRQQKYFGGDRNELEFISFGSGSSGNCAYLGVRGKGGILIDAGVEADIVIKALANNYILPEKISGIIITHDHSDHVRYAYALLRRYKWMKIYCTPRNLSGLLRRHSISNRIKEYHKPIFKEFEFDCGPFKITPFEVNHDGSDNVGFSIAVGDACNFVVATDMGNISDRADFYIRKANYLMIEANYDEHMLAVGVYPEYLKARIRSARGHLDNEVTASYLSQIYTPQLTHIYLCHLSHDNNRPDIAINAVKSALNAKGVNVGDASGSAEAKTADVQLYALPRYDSSPLFVHRLS